MMMGSDLRVYDKRIVEEYDHLFGIKNRKRLLMLAGKGYSEKYIRINFSKERVLDFFKKNRVILKKSFLPNCYRIEKSFFNLSSTIFSLHGYFHIQDIASQIPINMVSFKDHFKKNGLLVLDMAASPGSKTSQIYYALKRDGFRFSIIALEPNEKRILKLINNLQKQKCANVSVLNVRGEDFVSDSKFDLIILDAPCSGNLYSDKNWLRKRSMEGIYKIAFLQRRLLEKGISLLKKGGILIYSTCSIQIQENEDNIKWVLKNFKNKVKLVPSSFKFPFKTKAFYDLSAYRFMPYETGFQGFFVAIFKRMK